MVFWSIYFFLLCFLQKTQNLFYIQRKLTNCTDLWVKWNIYFKLLVDFYNRVQQVTKGSFTLCNPLLLAASHQRKIPLHPIKHHHCTYLHNHRNHPAPSTTPKTPQITNQFHIQFEIRNKRDEILWNDHCRNVKFFRIVIPKIPIHFRNRKIYCGIGTIKTYSRI